MVLEPFDPAAISDADWADCYALHCAAHREQGTDAPSLHSYRTTRQSSTQTKRRRAWVLREGCRVVAKIDFWLVAAACGAFSIYVLPAHRRRGAARALIEQVSAVAEAEAIAALRTGAVTEPGCGLCVRFGGQLEHRGVYQVLPLAAVDAALLERLAADGARRSPRTELLEIEVLPDELAADYLALHAQVSTAAQQGALALPAEPLTLEQRRATELALKQAGSHWLTLVARDGSGACIAMTEALYDRERPDLLQQQLTGVVPAHRGRGLAQWLKAELLLRLRERFPEVQAVTTHNLEDNAPIMAINRRIGFRPTTLWSSFRFPTERLRSAPR